MIVVKLGGSLFSHPRLRNGLRAYLEELAPSEVWLVAGGGAFVDCLRNYDRLHRLGEEASHWLAIAAMDLNAAMISRLIDLPPGFRVHFPDCLSFARVDDLRPGALPHSWDATSDSIAARMAAAEGAERLILLKSIDIPHSTPWAVASERGWVDRCFPQAAAAAKFPIEAVNFAAYLDALER